MAIKTRIVFRDNHLTKEKVASANIVDLQQMSFTEFFDYMAQNSTVGVADGMAVMTWVDEANRGREVAKHLMEAVERELKRCGIETVAISWDGRDSPLWVLHWYKKLGFEEKAFGYQCCTLLKRL